MEPGDTCAECIHINRKRGGIFPFCEKYQMELRTLKTYESDNCPGFIEKK